MQQPKSVFRTVISRNVPDSPIHLLIESNSTAVEFSSEFSKTSKNSVLCSVQCSVEKSLGVCCEATETLVQMNCYLAL